MPAGSGRRRRWPETRRGDAAGPNLGSPAGAGDRRDQGRRVVSDGHFDIGLQVGGHSPQQPLHRLHRIGFGLDHVHGDRSLAVGGVAAVELAQRGDVGPSVGAEQRGARQGEGVGLRGSRPAAADSNSAIRLAGATKRPRAQAWAPSRYDA